MRKDVKKALKDLDDGKVVPTIELGGIGPGYEQTIQMLVFELLRADKKLPKEEKAQKYWGDDVVHRINEAAGGFTGAQVGSAKSFALFVMKNGFAKARRAVEPDRRILVSKNFPKWN